MKASTKHKKRVVLTPWAREKAQELEDQGKELNAQGQKMINAAKLLRGDTGETK